MRVLNRILEWDEHGIHYEADPRHAELAIAACGKLPARFCSTPGVLIVPGAGGADPVLFAADSFAFRSTAMRGQYLSLDRPEIQFSLTAPTARDWTALERLAKFLREFPRVVWNFPYQEMQPKLVRFTDSDDAGCLKTRASTSAGAVMHGLRLIKAYSSTQKNLTLSSGESEFYGTVKAASSGIGLINMA